VAVELIVRVLACLAEDLGIRATAGVFEVDPNTVMRWLVEAAEQLRSFLRYFFCEVHVRQMQLDELYAVLRGIKNGEICEKVAIKRLERSRHFMMGSERRISSHQGTAGQTDSSPAGSHNSASTPGGAG
jgi:hypothetical protein